ncbi:MAG: ferredoxin--NADP(+) reductase, partial [Methanomicrobia archaeon]|nr:ferredoxin--NADP(+) reductase [Methanomicrobia archaeon]
MNKQTLDIIIIGGGPIGLLSLIQGCQAHLDGLLFESRDILGGQLTELYP